MSPARALAPAKGATNGSRHRGGDELTVYQQWIAEAAAVCQRAANGDLEARVLAYPREGDLGRMLGGINHLLDVTDAFVREASASLQYASQEKFFRRVLLRGLPGTFRNAARLINGASAQMADKSRALAAATTRRLELANGFEGTITDLLANFVTAAGEMGRAAHTLNNTATTTTDQATAVAGAAEQIAAVVQTVASASEELTASVGEIGRQVTQSSTIAQGAVGQADAANETVTGLSEASATIGRVVKLITEIAGQTNLLALNAAIEAARAGEAGKGFAVVAAEVKTLARQTASATEDIARQIHAMQDATTKAVEAIAEIGRTIRRMSEISGAITTAVNEQKAAIGEITHSMSQAAQGTKEVSHNVVGVTEGARHTSVSSKQMVESAESLADEAQALREAADRFLADVRAP